MSTLTTNYGFIKAAGTEQYDVTVVNANLDDIDGSLKAAEDRITSGADGAKKYAELLASTALNINALTDTGLALPSFDFVLGRWYEIIVDIHIQSTVANDRAIVYLRRGASTVMRQWLTNAVAAAAIGFSFHASHIVKGDLSGAQTLKLSMARAAGTGFFDLYASAVYINSLTIKDIGDGS